jgi:transcription elongation GreA/GreB family factor
MMEEAHEAERAKKERNREICAKIEAQIRLREEKERNMKIIFQPPKPKKKFEIDLAAIADMEDDDDSANSPRD